MRPVRVTIVAAYIAVTLACLAPAVAAGQWDACPDVRAIP
eukprot:CAMPEP_0174847222 /NCGR_PEP_ID=MMETSP1114-20130205/12781_1 /TAXON_ID=312471 /ORGANISM="Neobodo designis, Strain CCAP 1951/1" /LENGTH=39 /DNA_ID= /DNA_START= /DNA_END= /DNA_ORIENTATION=